MQSPDIRLAGLSAGYQGHRVLHEVTATLPSGKITALLGPNGSGKSTLLAALAGVVPLLAGTITGRDGVRPALVVQQSAVPPTLPITVRETVAMGRWAHRGPWRRLTAGDHAIIGECLDRLAIADLAGRRLDTLSGGQRQRALLAQALAQQSPLLLLDEPTTGLDLAAREQITRAIAEVSAAGVTVVHATHDLDDALRADHCVHLRDGRVVSEGEPRTALLAHSP
ncbi:zinc ABC transporter ATP-binding protein AztA [Nocardia cyriacigeorgica]|uniref:zinc ABC transporter ATP-binding protein AztA n=1 Tax=Nocardia cyriacigeorgica TaxID=135487 RepID=UPI001895E974|nr:zinc ABC transporter ATP-binding protein AztA [Nocardia cyriacigeorgica]MBF6452059.1 ATP-binding cassette domain-containing protein [Nocardia cyriacigeorgica]MBF6479108.1 ATP-binding cassette domain-containing protein [Nocardia cyriacigeorgica]MBF6549228.1 ATP-binding cassette domain-containing protein [Nocardia cyriacigeorgica]